MQQSRSHPIRKSWLVPTLLLVAGYCLYLIRFGYGYGSSDQDEFLPYLLHLTDNSFFENDWFVQTQMATFSVRTFFVYVLRILSFVLPIWFSVLLVYLTSWAGIAIALYRLADFLSHNRFVAIISTAFICLLTPFWTLGGNDLLHSMLVPSMTAWAIGLWAFFFYLKQQYLAAAFYAGLATLMQALVGLQIAGLIALLLLLSWFFDKNESLSFKRVVRYIVTYAAVASFALVPLFYQQFNSTFEPDADQPSLFYIMALFRNPHHYLFYSFNKIRVFQFFLLLLVGYMSLLLLKRNRPSLFTQVVFRLIAIIAFLGFLAFVGTEVYPSLILAKLQLFKMTIILKMLMVISACTIAVRLLPKLTDKLDHLVFERPALLALLLLGAVSMVLIVQPGRFSQKIYAYNKKAIASAQLAEWGRSHADQDEVFAVPPSWSSFRYHAQRAIAINHKAFPYHDRDIPEWFNRIKAMAPGYKPERTDGSLLEILDNRYNALSSQVLEHLSFEYEFDYVIRSSPLADDTSQFELIHKNGDWLVYRLADQRIARR